MFDEGDVAFSYQHTSYMLRKEFNLSKKLFSLYCHLAFSLRWWYNINDIIWAICTYR